MGSVRASPPTGPCTRRPPSLAVPAASSLSDLLASVEGAWSLPSTFADTGAHEGYRRVVVASGGRLELPQFADLLAEFQPVREAWLSWIDPGGFVVEHIDGGPHFERWQIPFTEAGTLYEDGRPVPHEVGVPFVVHHNRWHAVRNDDTTPRISLVIDRDVIVSAVRTPFLMRG